MNFIEKVLKGLEFADTIDDYIEDWNASDTADELHEFLGFTWNEYALWCEDPSSLRAILASRKHHTKIDATEWEGVHLLAARAQSQQDPEILKSWLTQKGLL